MKHIIFGLIVLFLSTGSEAQSLRLPQLIEVGVSEVFIPTGFDDNDNVEIVIEGYFPNTCYKVAPPIVQWGDANGEKSIVVTPRAYRYQGPCLQTIVRYKNVVGLRDHIGFLKEGNYNVSVKGYPPSLKLFIAHSNNDGPDDFTYAPVDEVSVASYEPSFTLRLQGEFLNRCFSMDRVKVLPPINNVISILPIVKHDMHTAEKTCAQVITPFEILIPIEKEVGEKLEGRYLFHVRSIEGTSKNLLESF